MEIWGEPEPLQSHFSMAVARRAAAAPHPRNGGVGRVWGARGREKAVLINSELPSELGFLSWGAGRGSRRASERSYWLWGPWPVQPPQPSALAGLAGLPGPWGVGSSVRPLWDPGASRPV